MSRISKKFVKSQKLIGIFFSALSAVVFFSHMMTFPAFADPIDDELLVQFTTLATEDQITQLNQMLGSTALESFSEIKLRRLRLAPTLTPDAAIMIYQNQPIVSFAVSNEIQTVAEDQEAVVGYGEDGKVVFQGGSDASGETTTTSVCRGIDQAVSEQARVILLNFKTVDISLALAAELDFAFDQGKILVSREPSNSSRVLYDPNLNEDDIVALASAPLNIRDVAIVGRAIQDPIVASDLAYVDLTVSNMGCFTETADISLVDITDHINLGMQRVTLESRAEKVVTFTWNTFGATRGLHWLRAIAELVEDDANPANNAIDFTTTLEIPLVHDVALVNMNVPADAKAGDQVTVSVTMANQGTVREISTLTLSDMTAGLMLGSQDLSLEIGESLVAHFSWDTSATALGSHILRVHAAPSVQEIDLADNTLDIQTNINPVIPKVGLESLNASHGKRNKPLLITLSLSNHEDIPITVSTQCSLYNAAGSVLKQTLIDQSINLPSRGTGVVRWTDLAEVPSGTYLVRATVVEVPGKEQTATMIVR